MNLRDYLINWPAVVASWHWLLPSEFTVWMMNRFEDLLLKTRDGKIHRLALDGGAVTVLAESKKQFCDKLDEPGFADEWFLMPLVDKLVAAGKELKQGECYALMQVPIVGGAYVVENVTVGRVADQYAALGSIFEKLRGVPDRSPVCIMTMNQ